MSKTEQQYDNVIEIAKDLFAKKLEDYGLSWTILRLSSLTDQIYIKANRIRSIDQSGLNEVGDSIKDEFIGIINYGLMALIQCSIQKNDLIITKDNILQIYCDFVIETKDLMQKKNHDYAEAWRDMRISSMTDLILMKILRLKQIEDHKGKTLVSEGVESNYRDIINYAVFCTILIIEQEGTKNNSIQ